MDTFRNLNRLVIGTHNRKKGAELAELVAPWGIAVATLADMPGAIEVAEDGDTFAANARLKASEQAKHLHAWVIADDSGLEVDALGGAPGVYSARFATVSACATDANAAEIQPNPATGSADEANNRELLRRLNDVPLEKRTARYVCHVVLADPSGEVRAEAQDCCRGRIRCELAGANGFGYDPLFEVVEYHRTFGELGPSVKRAISHRSRAIRLILPQLLAAWKSASAPKG